MKTWIINSLKEKIYILVIRNELLYSVIEVNLWLLTSFSLNVIFSFENPDFPCIFKVISLG